MVVGRCCSSRLRIGRNIRSAFLDHLFIHPPRLCSLKMDGMAESSRSARNRSVSPPPGRDPNTTRRSRSRSRSLSDASMSSSRHTRRSPSPTSAPRSASTAGKTAVRVDYLTHNVRESHLRHIFGWYGRVQRVHLVPSRLASAERDGSAYVLMSSVEQAAKAALYMSGGQIDGAIVAIKTCEPPADLPPSPTPPQRRPRLSAGYDDRDRKYARRADQDDGRDARRHSSQSSWSARERDAGHPDRRRNGGPDAYRNEHRPKPMRQWGQPERRAPSDSRRQSSPSRSMSPQATHSPHHRRRSSGATRASPSY